VTWLHEKITNSESEFDAEFTSVEYEILMEFVLKMKENCTLEYFKDFD
jgi:hypothetical protein